MNWLASPLWNLFYLAWIPVLLAYAYYSRHENIQKLTLCWLVAYVASNLMAYTDLELEAYKTIDIAGAIYVAIFRFRDPYEPAARIVFWLFIAMVFWHTPYDSMPWLAHQIAYNLMAMAQLAALCIYGKRYGIIARAESGGPRSDLYFRALTACRLMQRDSRLG